ncbi:uncharacterized protein LOC111255201 isoform X2 [Varroa destructor]|uniref:Uncharacterized protein n=1 Tax=Varroa destructor TaxID=109461 RepID=A0A7M7KW95_VARDE|nr:uncharacterized protein LOC111255201 isoform X2 [Varroa destructor]
MVTGANTPRLPSMSDTWCSGVERRSSSSDTRAAADRTLNISEVRERCPTMSAELISADSEFPARAGHVVQRRTSVPPAVLAENICDTRQQAMKCTSGRAILGRGGSAIAANSFVGNPPFIENSDVHNTSLSTAGGLYNGSDICIRQRIGRLGSPKTPTPHPLIQQSSLFPIKHVHHSPLHSAQRRWSSGDSRVEHETNLSSVREATPYFGVPTGISGLSNAPLASSPFAYGTGSWDGVSRPFTVTSSSSAIPKTSCTVRPTGPVYLPHWRDGLSVLPPQNKSPNQRDLRSSHINQRQREVPGQFASGNGLLAANERRSLSTDEAHMLYQVALGSRDLIDRSVEPHMLRPLPAELFHRDSVVVIERPDLADIFKPPPQLSS